MPRNWSVVIPSAKHKNLLRSAGSVFRTHSGLEPSRVVVVDDGARPGSAGRLPEGLTWVGGLKPFVFARNINLGVAARPRDGYWILMNDDVELETPSCFDKMERFMERNTGIGLLSPGFTGRILNYSQVHSPGKTYAKEEARLIFACVMIRKEAWRQIGPLDERFTGYGRDDIDYSLRAMMHGWEMGTLHKVRVRQSEKTSTYRKLPDLQARIDENRRKFFEKWGFNPFLPRKAQTHA